MSGLDETKRLTIRNQILAALNETGDEDPVMATLLSHKVAPLIAGWLAEERERIALVIEGLACDGSPQSCDDVLAGAPCPYDVAAQCARGDA